MSSSPPTSPRSRLYQIDFTAVQTGKHIASTKRRVRWRFGFANAQALARGLTGQACRGSEHEVTFLWSVTSGKCVVMADGQEVHYSTSRSSVFDYSWTMKGNHILKIVAHAAPPLSQTPNFRQYDLFINGQSFFTFPKVFRLGLAPGQVPSINSGTMMAERGERRRSSADITNLEAPNNPDEEEAYLQEAIRQSLQDDGPAGGGGKSKKKSGSGKGAAGADAADLLDFGPSASLELAVAPAPAPSTVATQNPYSYGGVSAYGAGAPPPAASDPFGYAAAAASSTASLPALPPTTTAGYGAPPATAAGGADPWASSSMASLPPTTNGYGGPPASTTGTTSGYGGYGGPPPPTTSSSLSTSIVPVAPAPAQASSSPWALPAATQQQPPPPPTQPNSSSYAPWASQTLPAAGASAAAAYNPQGQPPRPPPPQQQQYGAPPPAAPAAAAATTTSWAPPPPIQTTTGYGGGAGSSANPFGGGPPVNAAGQDPFGMQSSSSVPTTVTPHAQPSTPSTIGFMSPAAPSNEFGGFGSPEPASNPATTAGANEPALFSMNSLATFDAAPTQNGGAGTAVDMMNGSATANGGASAPSTSTSLADQAYSKLVNMDTFSLVSKNDAPRSNPFDLSAMSSSIGGSQSLADIQAKKASTSSGPAKPIMNTPMPAPGAMVMSSNQNGAYGAAYGVQPQQQPQQPSQYYGGSMGMGQAQPPAPYGQTAMPQQPQYGQPYAAPAAPMYGQSPYGGGAPAPPQQAPMMAQPSYGGAYGAAPTPAQGFF